MPEVVLKYSEGRYTGEVSEETGEPEGTGMIEFPGNDEHKRQIYEGEFKDKKAHGTGVMKWSEGDKYEGDWVQGLRHGKGTYISKAAGCKYEGEYVDDLKSGQGKYTYATGDVYEGSWVQGKRHGLGKYTYKENGGVYEGEWVDGVKQGKGTYTFESGDIFEGIYENNERNGDGSLVKVDGEKRAEVWKLGKLINFTIIE